MTSPETIGACGRYSAPRGADNHSLLKVVSDPRGKAQPGPSLSVSVMFRGYKESQETATAMDEHRGIVLLEQRANLVEKDLVGHGWKPIRLIIWIFRYK